MQDTALTAHIESLEQRHAALDKEIAALTASEVYDDAKMAELKRQKLLLKDEIAQSRTELAKAEA